MHEKTKEQYVRTDINGKATGWSAYYIEGKWVETLAKKKAVKKKAKKTKATAKKG